MNRKKLFTMVASLSLVAVIGIGATLAYMTSTTAQKTNTFTVGKVNAELDEKTDGPDGERSWEDDKDGKNMYPGQSVVKKPIMTIKAGSSNSFAFLKVTGADELVNAGFIITSGMESEEIKAETISAFSEDWEKVADSENNDLKPGDKTLDGIYRYVGDDADGANAEGEKFIAGPKETDTALQAPIFDMVTYRNDMENPETTQEAGKITVIGCAVQADGLRAAEALEQAKFVAADNSQQ